MQTYAASQVVLVTGASSGIGRSIARHLTACGHRVYGTSRQPKSDTLDGFRLLRLDVTDDESVADCVAAVIADAGRIDVLVNNAGIDMLGAVEEQSLDDAKWVFETNYFGAVRMIRAVLPTLRAMRRGKIILIGSALGLASFPMEAHYCASKHAIEGLAESLNYELNPFGIRVAVVEPGFYQSNMPQNQRMRASSIPDYDAIRVPALALNAAWAKNAPDPQPVAVCVERIIRARIPRLRHRVGIDAQIAPRVARLVPQTWLRKVGRWGLGLDDLRRDLAISGAGALGVLAAAIALVSVLRRR